MSLGGRDLETGEQKEARLELNCKKDCLGLTKTAVKPSNASIQKGLLWCSLDRNLSYPYRVLEASCTQEVRNKELVGCSFFSEQVEVGQKSLLPQLSLS